MSYFIADAVECLDGLSEGQAAILESLQSAQLEAKDK